MSAIHVESRVGEHVGHVGNADNHVGIRVGRALLFSMLGPIPAVISACHQKENTEATSLWLLRYTYHVTTNQGEDVDTWKMDIIDCWH